ASRDFTPTTLLEVCLLLGAAGVVGANQGAAWGPTAVPGHAVMSMLCLAVLAVVQHLRTFSSHRLVVQRERAAGLSPTAYFLARAATDVPWVLAAPAIYTLPYYAITAPRAPWLSYYIVSVGVWWWASGLAYLVTLAPLMPRAAESTAAVLVTLICGAFLHGGGSPTIASARGTGGDALLSVSYSRWSLEALSVSELDRHMDTHRNVIAMMYRDKGTCGVDRDLVDDGDDSRLSGAEAVSFVRFAAVFGPGYCDAAWSTALGLLFVLGLAARVLALGQL
ncbi:ABC transporter G family member 24, partial [Tetrabaena socialis]